MINIGKLNVLVLLIIFIFGCGYLNNEVKSMKITIEEAIKIANKEAEKLNYNVSEMNIKIDENNTVWKKYSSSINFSIGSTFLDDNQEIKTKLKNKSFWAIYYMPKNINQFGGDLWIFINKDTGKIILFLKGK